MITTGNVQVSQVEVISVTCDRCGKTYTPENIYEWQELHTINFTGGYGSVFGDMAEVSVDFCQRCFKELINPYCRIE